MIGGGREQEALERSIETINGFRMLGSVPEAGRCLRAFDVLVLSSRTEGTPMVALEAMRAEVPVVAFAVGGLPDLLADDRGVLVPPGDADALREAVESVRKRPEAAAHRASRARGFVEQTFSYDRWLEEID